MQLLSCSQPFYFSNYLWTMLAAYGLALDFLQLGDAAMAIRQAYLICHRLGWEHNLAKHIADCFIPECLQMLQENGGN
jgi:hypothetical protein